MFVSFFIKRQCDCWGGDTGYLIIDSTKTNLKLLGIEGVSKEESFQVRTVF